MAEKKSRKRKSEIEKGKPFKKLLPVVIDAAAAAKKDRRIRACHVELDAVAEEMLPFKQKRKRLSEEIAKLTQEAESLTEEHEVKCVEEFDFKHRVIRVRRLDTKKHVPELERTMEDGDRAEELFEKDKRKNSAGEKAPKLSKADREHLREAAEAEALAKGSPPPGDAFGDDHPGDEAEAQA